MSAARGVARVDEEVAVFLADLGGADAKPAAAGLIDQLPGLVAGRILEGRAAGLATGPAGWLRGCATSSSMRARIASGSSGVPSNTASTKMKSSGTADLR